MKKKILLLLLFLCAICLLTVALVACNDNGGAVVLDLQKVNISVNPVDGGDVIESVKDGVTLNSAIIIPDSVTKIGSEAFKGHSELRSVKIPNSVKEIGRNAFENCVGFSEIAVPDSVTKIGAEAFKGCTGLKKLTLPFVGEYPLASENNNLGYLFDERSYTKTLNPPLGPDAYDVVVDNATYVPQNLKEVIISGGTVLLQNAFNGCKWIETVVFKSELQIISAYAFAGCASLKTVMLPSTVQRIESYAFKGVGNLDIHFMGTRTAFSDIEKYENWDSGMGGRTVRCSDGLA